MFAVPSFFGYNTTFVSTPVATAATGVGSTSFTANWNAFAGASYYLLDVSTSSSFSSFVGSYQNFVVLSTSQLVSGLTASTTYYYRLRAATGVDADAAAFFSRVYTAGGALSYTEVSATETLVSSMKADGTWTPMKAIYPMIGASAAACAQNLKSSSFTVTFASGLTYSSSGILGNGTSGYGDTSFNVNTSPTDKNSVHCSVYQINNVLEAKSTVGATTNSGANGLGIFTRYQSGSGDFYGQAYNPSVLGVMPNTDSKGFYVATRTTLLTAKQYKTIGGVTTSATNTTTTTSGVNGNFYLLGNGFTSIFNYSAAQINFCSIGDGLTDTQAGNFYTAVQAFQTTLSRNV